MPRDLGQHLILLVALQLHEAPSEGRGAHVDPPDALDVRPAQRRYPGLPRERFLALQPQKARAVRGGVDVAGQVAVSMKRTAPASRAPGSWSVGMMRAVAASMTTH